MMPCARTAGEEKGGGILNAHCMMLVAVKVIFS